MLFLPEGKPGDDSDQSTCIVLHHLHHTPLHLLQFPSCGRRGILLSGGEEAVTSEVQVSRAAGVADLARPAAPRALFSLFLVLTFLQEHPIPSP